MSSILKALRKIEEVKRVAESTTPDLTHDQGAVYTKSSALRPLFAGIALGAMMVGLLIFVLSMSTADLETRQPTVKPLVIATPEPPAQAPFPSVQREVPVVSLPATNLTTMITPAVPEHNSIKDVDAGQLPVVVLPRETIAVNVAGRPEPVLVQDVKTSSSSLRKPEIKTKSDITAAVKSTPKVKPLPFVAPVAGKPKISFKLPSGVDLKLTEIFYQKDSASSMAVINDLPVMVGSQIDSAVVTDIRPESVLVEINDKIYNLALTLP
jgi:hypothetical protein